MFSRFSSVASALSLVLGTLVVSSLGGCSLFAEDCNIGATRCDGHAISECKYQFTHPSATPPDCHAHPDSDACQAAPAWVATPCPGARPVCQSFPEANGVNTACQVEHLSTCSAKPFALDPGQGIFADVNGDKKLDLISLTPEGFTVSLANGDGTFRDAPPQKGAAIESVMHGDFDGDGILDLALGLYRLDPSASSVAIAKGHGDGTFDIGPELVPFDHSFTLMSVFDTNGDGLDDFLGVNLDNQKFTVLLRKPDGITRLPSQDLPCAAEQRTSCALRSWHADVNGDGRADFAVDAPFKETFLMIGKGDGTFTASRAIPAAGIFQPPYDFDGDGKLDLVAATDNTLDVRLGKGDGTFVAAPGPLVDLSIAPYTLSETLFADVDGDGQRDLIAHDSEARVTAIRRRTAGGFAPPRFFQTVTDGEVRLGDVHDFGAPLGRQLLLLRVASSGPPISVAMPCTR